MSGIDDLIRKAIEDGKFDDLSGKGKPLNLEENPHEDPEWRIAYRMLRQSGYTLPWIESRREIDEAIDDARSKLNNAWEWRQWAREQGRPQDDINFEWQRARATFAEQIGQINTQIKSYNLAVPNSSLQLPLLVVDSEVKSIVGRQDTQIS